MSDEKTPEEMFMQVYEQLFPLGYIEKSEKDVSQAIGNVSRIGVSGVADAVSSFIASGGNPDKLREFMMIRAVEHMNDPIDLAKEFVRFAINIQNKL